MRKDINFAVLAIGNLGLLGEISLKSISQIHYQRIHAMADVPGKTWLQKQALLMNLDIEFHEPPKAIAKTLDQFGNDYYSQFGESKFFQLMYLKWILIERALKSAPDIDFLVFTDLDVLWRRSIDDCIDDIFSDVEINVAGQSDWNNKLELPSKFLCPGIMLWRNSTSSLQTLERIREFHQTKISQNINFPDDKAINEWMHIDDNIKSVALLSPHEFVIGHRILEILRGKSEFKIRNFRAFHANYCSGSSRKILRLGLLSLSSKSYPFRFVALGLIVCEIAVTKAFRALRDVL
jgi:hypothetical protein